MHSIYQMDQIEQIEHKLIILDNDDDRRERILQIERDTKMIAEIAACLNQMVHDVRIDLLEQNIEDVKHKVEAAELELKKSFDYKKTSIIMIGGASVLIGGPIVMVLAGVKAGLAMIGCGGVTMIVGKIM
jgi:hypothetical protein